ncbi:MAG: SAM-dependent chlorinase/fluorinase [Planctomycetota bacterium]
MADPAIITLTTDFGVGSPYVGAMKASVLAVNPGATVVDVCHTVPPQDVAAGARVLESVTPGFPAGSIHVAVVDPGVGTTRAIVYAEIGGQRYVCPDNGLLSWLAERAGATRITRVAEERFFRHPVSATFHGRDIMAPVAGHLSLGVPPEQLGPPHGALVTIERPRAVRMGNRITGRVTHVDSFGNLITDITAEQLEGIPRDESLTVHCDGHETQGIFTTYGEQPPMTLVALLGSDALLELAIVDDSAAIMLGVTAGAAVEVSW